MGKHEKLQPQISRQARPYSSVNVIQGLIDTCYLVFWALAQFGKTKSQCPDFFRIFYFYDLDIWGFKFTLQWAQ